MRGWADDRTPDFGNWVVNRLLMLSLFWCCFSTALVQGTENQPFSDSPKQLAERVATISGLRSPIHLELQGDEIVTLVAGTEWQNRFEQELQRRQIDLTNDRNAPTLCLYAARTPTQIVFVVKTRASDRDEVRIVAVSRQGLASTDIAGAALRLERQLIYKTPDRILDATYPENSGEGGLTVLVMRNAELAALRLNDAGAITGAYSIAVPSGAVGRDAHAEVSNEGSHGEIILRLRTCQFDVFTGNSLKCRNVKPRWRESPELTAPCNYAPWKLTGDGDDWTAKEALTAVQDEGAPSSSGLHSEFPGPILAIHAANARDRALVVVRNLQTGNYELYKITLACGD